MHPIHSCLLLMFATATFAIAAIPTTPPAYPKNWAPNLDKEIAGIKPLVMNLWDTNPPGFVENAPAERDDGTGRIHNVNIPGLIVYLPPLDKRPKTGGMTCIIDCMGGSYTHLTRLVGADHAVDTFTPKGIAIIALKYRLKPPSDVARDALADGKRALRLVRLHAKEWGIDPNKIGMLGTSAGGNLILNLCTHFDLGDKNAADPIERESCRPDFAVMTSPWPNALPITAFPAPAKPLTLPPAFIASARNDRTAPFTFAKSIEALWKENGANTEFIDVPTGGHGAFEIGIAGEGGKWPEKFLPWLDSIGMWNKP